MKKKYFSGFLVFFLSGVVAPVFAQDVTQVLAQYVGPTQQVMVRSAAAASKSPDDTAVSLEGYLISRLRDAHYIFRDDTGVIEVEIDHKYFPATPVSEKTKVRLLGKVDKDFAREATVEVRQLDILAP